MNKKKIEDVEDILIEIIADHLSEYTGLDGYYEENELSDEEIEFVQSLKVVSLVLSDKIYIGVSDGHKTISR